MLADFVNGHDVRMVQACRCVCFKTETTFEFLPCQRSELEQFHRDDAIQRNLTGFVDHPHAATGDFLQQLVIAEGMENWTRVTRWRGTCWLGNGRPAEQTLRTKPIRHA